MAFILPYEPEFKNESERFVYNFIKEKLPDNWICYFNYKVKMTEFDILLIVPQKGVFIIEIKGISGDQTIRVKDNTKIIYGRNGIIIPSPLKQADGYRFKLMNLISNTYNKNPIVFSIVAYPNLSYDSFRSNQLDIISAEEQTFLMEDFDNEVSFINKFNNLYEEIQYFGDDTDILDNSLVMDIRKLFEPEDSIEPIFEEELEEIEKVPYSIFVYNENFDEDLMKDLLHKWSKGTKILFVSNNANTIKKAKDMSIKKVEELSLDKEKAFSFIYEKDGIIKESNNIFNLYFYMSKNNSLNKSIIIEDGNEEDIKGNIDLLRIIDTQTDFNLNQYIIEHAPINTNMMIKAGAGTGKTYSMISRIMFLNYAHDYSVEEFKKRIIMITFTNEAAANMKTRLQDYLQNLYFLTRQTDILNKIESIEDMNISTIHSLTKKILQKYSTVLGLGKELSIKSGVHERNTEILNELDDYINQNYKKVGNVLDKSNISMYNLQKRIRDLIIKLENKNVDLISDEIDYGKPNNYKELWDLIINVATNVTKNLRDQFDKKNAVRLSDLIIKLKQLVIASGGTFNLGDEKVDYLFVDEFQDTDDTQINLMKSFRDIIGFKFFAVGDIKQCIYRFRGAEKEAFETLLHGEDKKSWRQYSLSKNYRTDSLLLDKYHDIFIKLGDKGILDYVDNTDFSDRLRGVKVLNDENDDFFTKIDFEDEEERDAKLVSMVKDLKNNLKDDSQIAILVRENKQVEKIRTLFSKNGEYVYTDVGGDLYKIRPTIDLYKLVLALQNNKDPVYLYNLYSTSYIKTPIPKTNIIKSKENRDKLLNLFYSENPIPKWSKYLEDINKYPVMKVLKDIINDIKPWENYSYIEESREERQRRLIYYRRNLEEIIEKLIDSADTDYLSINKIKSHLEIMILTKQEEEQREYLFDEGKNAKVLCLTVHNSKGLEFDTVVMPYCDVELTSSRKTGYVDLIIENQNKADLNMKYKIGYKIFLDRKSGNLKNNLYESQIKNESQYRKEEETRLLYVVMTRAIKKFIYFNNNATEKNDTWQNLIEGI